MPDLERTAIVGSRFAEAFGYAAALHRHQVRKGAGTPYVAHLMSVAALVLEDGGSEDEAIAALLHDAAEDQGGRATLEEIGRRFGPVVAAIVAGCSDALPAPGEPKAPWRERKERYLVHLASAAPNVRRVSLADKLHNARSILADYRRFGESVWDRFTASKAETLWYYRELVAIHTSTDSTWRDEFARVVATLEREASA